MTSKKDITHQTDDPNVFITDDGVKVQVHDVLDEFRTYQTCAPDGSKSGVRPHGDGFIRSVPNQSTDDNLRNLPKKSE